MRSIWAGAISFGLVVIPVKLYAATEQRDVAFRQVHREDGGRIQFRRFCSIDGQEVAVLRRGQGLRARHRRRRGADRRRPEGPAARDRPADRRAALRPGRASWTRSSPTRPTTWSRSPPGCAPTRCSATRSSDPGRVAVAKVAIRQREALAALRVRDGVLVLETLLWPDEVRSPDFKFLDEDVEVRSQELKMAASLIDTMTEDFDPVGLQGRLPGGARGARAGQDRGQRGGQAGGPAAPAEPGGRPRRPGGDAPRQRRGGQGQPRQVAQSQRRRRPMSPSRTAKAPKPRKARRPAQEGVGMTAVPAAIPHWPGRMVQLGGGEQVYVAETPRSVQDEEQRSCALRARHVRRGHELDRLHGRARARLRLRGG